MKKRNALKLFSGAKTLAVLLCSTYVYNAAAQTPAYYQKRYALSVTDEATAASSLGSSLLIAGNGKHVLPAVPKEFVSLMRTDAQGFIPQSVNTFSALYELKQGTTSLPLSTVGVASPGTTSSTPTNVITVAGNISFTPDLFVLTTNGDGTVRSAKKLIIPPFNTPECSITAVIGRAFTNNNVLVTNIVFLAGHVNVSSVFPNSAVVPFVIAMNTTTNTIVWSKMYDLNSFGVAGEREEVADIMLSDNELIVTGNARGGSFQGRGFILKLNPSNGNLIGNPFMITFKYPTKIKSISPTNTFSSQLHQIHLCGETVDINLNNGRANDVWVATLNTVAPTVVWSKQYDYSNLGDNGAKDVNNFAGRLLVTGSAAQGTVGGDEDMTVLRLDPADGTVDFEATYGTAGRDFGIAAEHHFGNAGFRAVGSGDVLPQTQGFYAVSAYYNGISGCNENITSVTPVNMSINTSFTTVQSYVITPAVQELTVVRNAIGFTVTNCLSTSVPGGDNSHQAEFEQEPVTITADPELNTYPNPVNASDELRVEYTGAGAEAIDMVVYDATGREVINRRETIQTGKNTFLLSPGNLSPGAYLLLIREGDRVSRQQLLVH